MIKFAYSLKQKIIEFKGNIINNDVIPIYMIHHVNDKVKKENENITIKNHEFKDFIRYLKMSGNEFIKPSMLSKSFGQKSCMLTFDDICDSAFENAISYLENEKIYYTCFISPKFIGKSEYINKDNFKYLLRSKFCTIGAHGLNHKMFRLISEKEKLNELSRIKHEEFFGCKIEDFAFPYGSIYACDKKSINFAGNEYKRVYSTLNYATSSKDNMNFLPRINLNSEYVLSNQFIRRL